MKESAGRVLMLVENNFPADTRVRNEARTLDDNGYQGHRHRASRARAGRPRGRRRRHGVPDPAADGVQEAARRATRRLVRRIVDKLQVVVGYVVRVRLLHARVPAAQPLCRRPRGVRRRSRPQSSGHAVRRRRRPQAARQEVRCSITTICRRSCICRATRPPRGIDHAGACGSREAARSGSRTSSSPRTRAIEAIDIARNGAMPERVFIVRNGPDLKRVRLVEPDDPAARHEQDDSGLRRRDEPAGWRGSHAAGAAPSRARPRSGLISTASSSATATRRDELEAQAMDARTRRTTSGSPASSPTRTWCGTSRRPTSASIRIRRAR